VMFYNVLCRHRPYRNQHPSVDFDTG